MWKGASLAAANRSQDTETDPDFAPSRAIAASSGFRAVQSTPLFGRGGELLGMLSTHFKVPRRSSTRDFRLTNLYVRLAADLIARARILTCMTAGWRR